MGLYVDPQTIHNPSTGASAPAAWGDAVRDALESLARFPAVRVKRTSDQSINDATSTVVSWQATDHEVGGNLWDIGTPSHLVAPFAGIYLVTFMARWASTSPNTGPRSAFLKKNGSTFHDYDDRVASGGTNLSSNRLSTELALSAADYVEIEVYQGNGAPLSVGAFATMSWRRMLTD